MSGLETPRETVAVGPPSRETSVVTLPSRRAGFGHVDVLALFAGLSFLVARFVPVIGLFPPCPVRELVGIPCATCGMTHAFVALAHGDWSAALRSSPLGATGAALGWAFAVVAVSRPLLRFRWPVLEPRAARASATVLVSALLLNWGWLVAAGGPHS